MTILRQKMKILTVDWSGSRKHKQNTLPECVTANCTTCRRAAAKLTEMEPDFCSGLSDDHGSWTLENGMLHPSTPVSDADLFQIGVESGASERGITRNSD